MSFSSGDEEMGVTDTLPFIEDSEDGTYKKILLLMNFK